MLSDDEFASLCALSSPAPLGVPAWLPWTPAEGPLRGRLFGLDAEFVALAPATRETRGGIEVDVRPARLGLARVSVVRGCADGSPLAPAIDDYVRQVEPVHDYLTRWSGLRPGDLDPRTSPHALTTLKRASAKLNHLVAAGAIFVGHGLSQDFRMINIVVPPSQVVDTVDLFRRPHARRLSLRFLASRLLNADIQVGVHDSVEDARTALLLHERYGELVEAGTLDSTLRALYDYGAVHGWDPLGAAGDGGSFGVAAAQATV